MFFVDVGLIYAKYRDKNPLNVGVKMRQVSGLWIFLLTLQKKYPIYD